jgi:hypothetical protein
MDLVRKIILICDAVKAGEKMPETPEVKGYSEKEVRYHVHLMGEAGLLNVADCTFLDDFTPQAVVRHMTWAGHDFADAAKSKPVWSKTKNIVGKMGGVTFEVFLDVMKAAARQQLKDLGGDFGISFDG